MRFVLRSPYKFSYGKKNKPKLSVGMDGQLWLLIYPDFLSDNCFLMINDIQTFCQIRNFGRSRLYLFGQ